MNVDDFHHIQRTVDEKPNREPTSDGSRQSSLLCGRGMNLVGGEQVKDLEQPSTARFKFGHFRNTLVKLILRKLVYPIILQLPMSGTPNVHMQMCGSSALD